MEFKHYLQELDKNLEKGSERTHYPALKNLIEGEILGINANIEETGNQAGIPDFTVRKNNNLLGYIEAKKISENLEKIQSTDQLKRYVESDIGKNLILTNYLEFRWYKDGKLKLNTSLGSLKNNKITANDNLEKTAELIKSFLNYQEKVINNYNDLAQQMANKTKVIRYSLEEALKIENETGELTALKQVFQELLLPDLDNNSFADMYAQTITYGLFTARVGHAQNPGNSNFNRQTASIYISDKIPFLQGLFSTVIATDIVSKINWAIEILIELLAKVDIGNILENFGRETRKEDPVVHFYETFLAAYEVSLRKSRGVYYTPEPVVSFIVKAVNHILDKYFDLEYGLGSRKVTILDPATGTGTFLYRVIKQIYFNFEKYGANRWNELLRDSQVLKRLYGFELLMTPYAIAHLKLGLLLETLGYRFEEKERLNIFLTNALDEGIKKSSLLLGEYISEEANQAARVKEEKPIFVVLGNPPYSVSSQNVSKRKRVLEEDAKYLADVKYNGLTWEKIYKTGKAGKEITELTYIGELLERYKGRVRLEGEKNIQPLDDDYIKFIRFAHDQIEKTGHGVIGLITNHSYINGLIHRGMREELMKYFDSLYIMDLHGNSLLKETTPDGEVDENVFDIQQDVAILIAVRQKSEPDAFSVVYKKRDGVKLPAGVFYFDLWGKREDKYQFLEDVNFQDVDWIKLKPSQPNFFFLPKNFDLSEEYNQGWSVIDIFPVNSTGINTHRDNFVIDFDRDVLLKRIQDFRYLTITDEQLSNRYNLKNTRDWKIEVNRKLLCNNSNYKSYLTTCLYRPFDTRFCFYYQNIVEYPRNEVMVNLQSDNLALISCRQQKELGFRHCLVTEDIGDGNCISIHSRERSYYFPLYIYPDTESGQTNLFVEKTANLSSKFLTVIQEKLGYIPTPENIFYYAYAIFHSPTYRQRYAEFLQIDFPRLPLTSNNQLFEQLTTQGEALANLHLLKNLPDLHPEEKTTIDYQGDGKNLVKEIKYDPTNEKIWINKNYYFTGVSQKVWKFKIGSYQVLDKWLKDRKKANRELSDGEINRYQKTVLALR
ncbi:MAG: N-6 DNA methylase [Okeania sp. SIO2C2]|uniref:type ISP restriction/modification enzyme n=1 Tax=Okeania sp. SIO2C2 TaxID=2607787 RepID=UPI0013B69153|nr:type ISP restriction/modification enzyme [Okeania sp. SIO2C2]NEP87631.1 N-6 DNA methylase [Okeania sp. SIO2C2]